MKIIKRIEWNEAKNRELQTERGLSFEQIQVSIEQNKLVDIIQHPSKKYEHQQILMIDIDDIIVLVPFVEDEEKIFLKTAFKIRKATKEYIIRSKNHAKKTDNNT